jgi:hypothetical protein
MRALPPLTITDAILTSSTAPEPGVGEAAWSAGTSYGIGDRAILGAPSSTVTISIASPGVVTWANNGLPNGTPVVLTTTGSLPTGLTAGVIYYVVNRATGSFQLSATIDGAPIVTTGSDSGTHTATASIHRVYESQTASNTGNRPAIDATGTNWIDVGPTNRWAMFDLERNTGTTVASPLTVVITPGQRIDSIGLVGLVADTVSITVKVGASTVYSYTDDLLSRLTVGWYTYFFGPFRYQQEVALFDLPPYTNAVITVTLTRASGNVTCGGLVIGQNVYLGETLQGAEREGLNFSKVDRDEFGNSSLVPRRSVPRKSGQIRCKKSNVPRILALIESLNAVVALWSGLDDQDSGYFPALLILGFYKKLSINMDQPNDAIITFEIEEV